ncbi:CLUMA_CG007564, isoform A [Clunio marinus]|uniref:CLUMA_CG007564, isoform A n=1 Tax=Clunio marinus TaxID=568069 RepID=A0A1J1I130_9DIPT|nr:CLUMA_CG007564, isoform A [Clunio marinus]
MTTRKKEKKNAFMSLKIDLRQSSSQNSNLSEQSYKFKINTSNDLFRCYMRLYTSLHSVLIEHTVANCVIKSLSAGFPSSFVLSTRELFTRHYELLRHCFASKGRKNHKNQDLPIFRHQRALLKVLKV